MSPDEHDLTPEQQARVSHLLADARADGPMPEDVAARLDGVLAGLGPEEDDSDVVALAARRRRQVGTMLVAAAAVIIAGVALGQLVGSPGQESASDATGGSQVEAPDRATAAEDQADGLEEALPEEARPTAYDERRLPPAARRSLGVPKPVSGRSFAADARRLQRHPGVRSVPGLMDGTDLTAPDTDFMCGQADFGPGRLVAVRYDGSPAVLAFREPNGDTQVVDLLQCGSGDVIRSTTLSRD